VIAKVSSPFIMTPCCATDTVEIKRNKASRFAFIVIRIGLVFKI